MKKIVMALSGGLDSTTMLGTLLHKNMEVVCLFFSYGSKHETHENRAAIRVTKHYNIVLRTINLTGALSDFKSNLLKTGGAVPEGHYEDKSMAQTVVPFRNGIILSVMAGYAESINAENIAIGIHQGDHAIYPDCRPDFYTAINKAVYFGTDKKVQIIAPFLQKDKIGILKEGLKINVPYKLTRTCYKNQLLSCGKCGSCNERLEAFSTLNQKDPIQYEESND